eukprot:CAMPEP_0197031082 /NCGR_PEP_ID=MMETSP1384-20130603/10185_1 /TAXON_ID=29189 /ORGANISM="Ammonia sp." /LENGTH=407 /DNA_ID=CAMNT_0042460559 /DNA_START=408 /DNA_END=1631 /DNA_ORIENTATION=-
MSSVDVNDDVIGKLLSLHVGTKEQCIDAFLAADDKTDIEKMRQYLIANANNPNNDVYTDSFTDDIKENSDDDEEQPSSPPPPAQQHKADDSFELLPVGLLSKYEQKAFVLDAPQIEQTSPVYAWSPSDATTFDVRRGPNYVSGQKAPSKPAIYEAFAMDTYAVPYKIKHITQFMKVEQYIEQSQYAVNAKYPLPPILIINIMVPDYSPDLKNLSKSYDGKGYQVIIYARLSQQVQQTLMSEAQSTSNAHNIAISPSLKLLSRFIVDGGKDTKLRDRFKCMGRVMNLQYTGFNFLTKKLISEYNAKPFLAKESTTITHEYGRYLAIDLDAHLFGYIAKKCWNSIKNIMDNVIYDLAFVIEAHSNDELPEQILTTVRISKVAAQKQRALPAVYLQRLRQMQQNEKQCDL